MSEYTIKSDQLTIVATTHGAELCSITSNETNTSYLWSGDSTYWGSRAPILFPMVGTLRNDKATIGLTDTCRMGRHGIARKQKFEMLHLCNNRVTFGLKSNLETIKDYPFEFELHVTYVVEGNTIRVHHSVKNDDVKDMPYCVGGHPAFHCPLHKDESFEDYQVRFEKDETADCAYLTADGLIDVARTRRILDRNNTIPLTHELFYDDALIFDSLQSRKVTLEHKETKEGVSIAFDGMDYLGVWSSVNDGPFVALEPWSGTATLSTEDDVFEHKRGVKILAPGELDRVEYQIMIHS